MSQPHPSGRRGAIPPDAAPPAEPMGRHLRRALQRVLKEAEADSAVVWGRAAGGEGGFVLRALPEDLIEPGTPWSAQDPGAVVAEVPGARLLRDPREIEAVVPSTLRPKLPAPPQAALDQVLGEGNLGLLVLWCGSPPPSPLPQERLLRLGKLLSREAQEAERELRHQLTALRLQQVMDHLEQAVVVLDRARRIAQVNGAAARLLSLAPGELPADTLVAALAVLEGRALNAGELALDRALLEANPLAVLPERIWRFEKAPTHLKVNSLPLQAPGFSGRMWVFDDISELKAKTEYLEAGAAAGIVGIWDWDVPADVLTWDPVMYKLYGLRPGHFGGAYQAWAQAIHPADKPYVEGEIQAALRGERQYAPRFRVIWPDGSVHHIQAASQTSFDGAGRPIRMLGVNYDLTEQANREEELAAAKVALEEALAEQDRASALFRQSMRNAAVGMCLCRPGEGTFLEVNPALCAFFHRDEATLLASSWQELTHPEDLAADVSLARQVLAGRLESYRLRKRFLRPDGAVVWGDLAVSCVRHGDGSAATIIAQIIDITEIVELQELQRREQQELQATLDSLFDPHVMLVPVRDVLGAVVDFRFGDANRAALQSLGRRKERVIGAALLPLLPGFATTGLLALCLEAFASGRPLALDDFLYPHYELTGSDRYLDIRAVRVGEALSFSWRDVSERRSITERIAASEKQYRLLAENVSDVVLLLREDRIEWASPALTRMLGWETEQWLAHVLEDFAHPEDGPTVLQQRQAVQEGKVSICRIRLRDANGAYRWVEVHANRFLSEGGTPEGEVATFRTVDAEVATEQELERRARYDDLTGLFNRVEMLERIQTLLVSRSTDEPLCLLFLDIDHFKSINDDYGHAAGDDVLRTVAGRIRACIRSRDWAARMGGDELLVLLVGVRNLEMGLAIAEKIRGAVALEIASGGHRIQVSLSIGVSLAAPGESVDSLIARADRGMYEAKLAGRNRVVAIPTASELAP